MRFALTAIDRYLGVFEALVGAGWQPVKLFSTPVRSFLDSQHAVIAYAEQRGVPIQLSPMTENDLRALAADGCEALIVASYNWKIPDWRPYLKYAANIHASPLPEGRGTYPPIRAILDGYERWAVTCHKITPEIDKGDILAAEDFPLDADETHESIDLKIQMAAKRLVARIAPDFEKLWAEAKPQGEGSYWPRWRQTDRLIDFSWPVERVMRHIRAFGLIESLVYVNGALLSVRRAVGWPEVHNLPPGKVAHINNRTLVVAAKDGYIGLLEWSFAPAEVAAEIGKEAKKA